MENQEQAPRYPYIWEANYIKTLDYLKDFEESQQLREILTGKYFLKLRLSKISDTVYINDKAIVYRNNKFGPVGFGKNCKLIDGMPLPVGGSNNHPSPAFKNGYCIVEVTTDSFPAFDKYTHRCKIEVLEFKKLT